MKHHPHEASLRTEYIRILVELSRWDEALLEINKIDDKTSMTYLCMMAVFRGQGNLEQAIATAKEGLKRFTHSLDLYNSLGVLFAEQGDFEQAKNAYQKALQLDPENSAIKRHLSLIQGINNDERTNLRSIFTDEHANREERVHAGFALANALDQDQEYHEAALILNEANTLHRNGFSYSVYWSGIHIQKIQDKDRLCSLDSLEPHKTGPRPIFIVGLPRSGSTLTEQILSTHSCVEGIGEVSDLFDCVEQFGAYPECLCHLSNDDLHVIRSTYLDKIARRSHAPVIVDKFLSNIWLVGLIRLIFPNAPILLMKRNPLRLSKRLALSRLCLALSSPTHPAPSIHSWPSQQQ